MKAKKFVVAVLAAILAVGAVFAFTACGDPTEEPPPTTNTKSFQLVGSFTDSLGPLGQGFEFMLNLNQDGTAVLARYNPYSYDASDAAENRNFEASFMEGTWKEADKDGVPCLQIKLAVQKEDGTTSDSSTSYAYDVAGEYSFDCSFPIVPGMGFTRTVTLKGGETKKYADDNAFIQGTKLTFTPPASIATFEAEGSTVYVQQDGTLLLYSGYTQYATGSYYKTSDSFGIIVADEEVNVTVEGNKATFQYTYSMGGGYDVDYTYVCEDISELPNIAPPASGEAPPASGEEYTATIMTEIPTMGEMDVTYTLTLNNDNTFSLSAGTGGYSLAGMSGTYVKTGSSVTLTQVGETTGYLGSIVREKLNWTLGENGSMTLATAAA